MYRPASQGQGRVQLLNFGVGEDGAICPSNHYNRSQGTNTDHSGKRTTGGEGVVSALAYTLSNHCNKMLGGAGDRPQYPTGSAENHHQGRS